MYIENVLLNLQNYYSLPASKNYLSFAYRFQVKITFILYTDFYKSAVSLQ